MSEIEKCHNKLRFASDMSAAAYSGKVAFKYGNIQRWYRCNVCLGWHLTSSQFSNYSIHQNRKLNAMVRANGIS